MPIECKAELCCNMEYKEQVTFGVALTIKYVCTTDFMVGKR